MDEKAVKTEIIKSLIQSPQAAILRGDISAQLIELAQPYVDYVMGVKPKPKKEKPVVMVGKKGKPVEADNA